MPANCGCASHTPARCSTARRHHFRGHTRTHRPVPRSDRAGLAAADDNRPYVEATNQAAANSAKLSACGCVWARRLGSVVRSAGRTLEVNKSSVRAKVELARRTREPADQGTEEQSGLRRKENVRRQIPGRASRSRGMLRCSEGKRAASPRRTTGRAALCAPCMGGRLRRDDRCTSCV